MTRLVFFLLVSCVCVVTALRHVDRIELPTSSIGTRRHLLVYSYTSATPPVDATATKRAYLQASLHADELPGMLVINHLLKLLDRADRDGHILQTLDLVPFANPVGLSQQLMGMHVGRFSVDTGVNFNREYPDVVDAVAQRLAGTLSATDATANVAAIRAAMREEIAAVRVPQVCGSPFLCLGRSGASPARTTDTHVTLLLSFFSFPFFPHAFTRRRRR